MSLVSSSSSSGMSGKFMISSAVNPLTYPSSSSGTCSGIEAERWWKWSKAWCFYIGRRSQIGLKEINTQMPDLNQYVPSWGFSAIAPGDVTTNRHRKIPVEFNFMATLRYWGSTKKREKSGLNKYRDFRNTKGPFFAREKVGHLAHSTNKTLTSSRKQNFQIR